MSQTLISKKRQLDLLTGALEGGSNYWYYLPDTSMCPKKGYTPKTPELIEEEKNFPGMKNCLVNKIWEAVQGGEKVQVVDLEDEKEVLGFITKEGLDKAGELMLREHPDHLADVLKENDDAITADVFFQYAVMEKLIYG